MKSPSCSKWRIYSLWCFWFLAVGGDAVTADPGLAWTSLLSLSTAWRPCNHWEGLRAHHINYRQLEKCDLDTMLWEQNLRADEDLLFLQCQGMVKSKLSYHIYFWAKKGSILELVNHRFIILSFVILYWGSSRFFGYHGCHILSFMCFHEFSFIEKSVCPACQMSPVSVLFFL